MRHFTLTILTCALAAGCARERDPAPTEMVDLVRFLFANWEDEELLPEAVDNLGRWLVDNVDTEEAEDGLRLDPLAPADIGSVTHPDTSLAELIGATGSARSAFPLEDHAGYLILPDQTFSNPSQYKKYDRTITAGDPEGFATGADRILRTETAVETSTLGVTIPYVLMKDYRWVTGEAHEAVVGRAWVEERFCNDGGGNCLEHTYSVDLFYADGPDASMRMTASWSHVEASISVPDDTLVASLAMGIQNVFRACEEFLVEQSGT